MSGRQNIGVTKITAGWRLQFPADARDAIEKRQRKRVKVGDRVAFYLEPDGRVIVELL